MPACCYGAPAFCVNRGRRILVYLFTALFCEAENMIEHYGLRKNTDEHKFQVFEGGNLRLVITGSGKIAAAAAVAYICGKYDLKENDFIVNIGVAGGLKEHIGNVYFVNKIVEESTERSYYPEMLYCHGFEEKTIVTVERAAQDISQDVLVDMEAAAVYQAALHFVYGHQLSFLKLVSDSGADSGITANSVSQLMKSRSVEICRYIDSLPGQQKIQVPVENPGGTLEKLVQDLHCSDVMEKYLVQLLRYCKLADINFEEPVRKMYQMGQLPCKSKKEGKVYLDELKGKLL